MQYLHDANITLSTVSCQVLRDIFHYHPKLTKEQFLSVGFAERKVILTTQVLLLSQTKHLQLTGKDVGKNKPRKRFDIYI